MSVQIQIERYNNLAASHSVLYHCPRSQSMLLIKVDSKREMLSFLSISQNHLIEEEEFS